MELPAVDLPITVMVSRMVSPHNREVFETALRDLTEYSLGYPGHLGVTVFRPHDGEMAYRILFKFDAQAHYDAWQASPDVLERIARVNALTDKEAHVTTLTGLESWFTLPGAATPKPPPRPKMALVTWGALFPLVSLLLTALQPVISRLPFLVGTLIITGLVTVLMTYVIMPRLTRLLAGWLFPRPQ